MMLPLLLAAAPAPESSPPAAPEDEASEPAAPSGPAVGRQSLPKESAFRVLGTEVKGPSGTTVAMVVNVVVDPQGVPLAAVLDYGGFLGVGKRRIAVAWQALSFGPSGITLSFTRDQLKNFPELREGEEAMMAIVPPNPG